MRDGTFTIAVCDLGCGYRQTIGETIPEKFRATYGALFKGVNRDAQAIDTAMAYGRSSTRETNRGKGSRDALSLLGKHGDGELVVVSNAGYMQYRFHEGREQKKVEGSLGIDIGGTIVWWKLNLTGGSA